MGACAPPLSHKGDLSQPAAVAGTAGTEDPAELVQRYPFEPACAAMPHTGVHGDEELESLVEASPSLLSAKGQLSQLAVVPENTVVGKPGQSVQPQSVLHTDEERLNRQVGASPSQLSSTGQL